MDNSAFLIWDSMLSLQAWKVYLFVAHPVNTPQDHKISLKRVMDFVKDKGDENAREINRKLQHMLEETLTKNMHLQKVRISNNFLVL